MKLTLERIHVMSDKEIRKVRDLNLNMTNLEEAIKEALFLAGSSQVKLFGDTGMIEGKYTINVTHIDDVPIKDALVKNADSSNGRTSL